MAHLTSIKTQSEAAANQPHQSNAMAAPNYALKETPLTLQYLMYLLRWPRPVGHASLNRFHRWIAAFAPKNSQIDATPAGHLVISTQAAGDQVFLAELTTPHPYKARVVNELGREQPQNLKLDTLSGQVSAKEGEVLGADSSVGIWLLLNLLYYGIEGTYVFWNTGSEPNDWHFIPSSTQQVIYCGGKGDDQLTHWIYECPTASEAFTQQLLKALNQDQQLAYQVAHQTSRSQNSSLGSEALYLTCEPALNLLDHLAMTVPEVVRLSSGRQQNTAGQATQDLHFACVLAHRLIRIPWTSLAIERNPQERLDYWLEETQLDLNDPRPF